MMELLIVEDDGSQRQIYERSVNSLTDLEINLEFANTYEEALEKFQNLNPDCIFIDIKLSSGDVENTKGNDLFEFISRYKSSKIIRIITSHVGDIEPEIKDLVNNTLFRIHERTELPFVDIIKETYEIFHSPIYSLVNVDSELLEKIRTIYYTQIDSIIKNKDVLNGLEKPRLLRYVASNLYESFSINQISLDDVYDWEMFFCPPILNFVYTGDIIKQNGFSNYFIVLNPPCDLTPRTDGTTNVNECILAKLETVDLRQYVNRDDQKFTGKGNEIIKNKEQSYHFIPQIKEIGPFQINFRKISHINKDSVNSEYTRIASITPAFMKEILHRFSAYYSRQGQPDLDLSHLFSKYSG